MAQGWRIHLQCRRHRSCGFSPWVREIPWRQKWQPTPVLLPGESHGQRSPAATVHRVAKSQTRLKRRSMHACLWSEFYGILSSKNLTLSIISLFLSLVPLINIWFQLLSHVWHFVTPQTIARQAPLSSIISWSLLRFISIELVMLSNHLILCRPLPLLPSIFPSIRVFSSELTLRIRWPKYWSFSFSISPSNEYSGLTSFRIGWFDLITVQGILKSLLQHHSLKASILQCSGFCMVQLSHPYMTTGKTIPLTF